MSRQFLPGADYVDALPSGEYVAMILEPIRKRQKRQRFRHRVTSRSTR